MHLEKGSTTTLDFTVGPADTAAAFGSGDLQVLSTPRLVAWLEAAAVATVEHAVEAGETSVGVMIELDHVAPSLIGEKIHATATVKKIDGRVVSFEVRATRHGSHDSELARGRHRRVVVDGGRFMDKARLA